MKQILFTIATVVVAAAATSAQEPAFAGMTTLSKTDLITPQGDKHHRAAVAGSEAARQGLYREFGDVPNVVWRRDQQFEEARFDKDGKQLHVFFDEDGERVATTTEATFDDLPAQAQAYINQHYGDGKLLEVIHYEDNEANPTDLYEDAGPGSESFFVSLQRGNGKEVLQVTPEGYVTTFRWMP